MHATADRCDSETEPSLGVHLAVLILFLGAAVVMTYPLALSLGDGVPEQGDPLFSAWTLAWGARCILTQDLGHLFGGNIFHPESWPMTYSDHLLGWQPVVLPIYALTGNIILAQNVALLLGTVLSGYFMFLLVHHLTSGSCGVEAAAADRSVSVLASVFAGLSFAFVPYRFQHISHLSLLGYFWMPLALYCLHRLIGSRVWGSGSGVMVQGPGTREQGPSSAPLPPGPRPLTPGASPQIRWGIGAGLAVAMQYLSGLYHGVFLAFLGVLLVLFLGPITGAWRRGRFWLAAGAGAAVFLAATAWSVVPYAHAHAALGLSRSVGDVQHYSCAMSDYLSAPPMCRLLMGVGVPAGASVERTAWLGLVVVGFAVMGLVFTPRFGGIFLRRIQEVKGRLSEERPPRRKAQAVRVARFAAHLVFSVPIFYALAAVLFFLLSLGPVMHVTADRPVATGPYQWLLDSVPALGGMRCAGRMSVMVSLCLTVLAGLGVAAVGRRIRRRGVRAAFGGGMSLLVLAEFWAAPLHVERAPVTRGAQALCVWLAAQRDDPVICHLPFPQTEEEETRQPYYEYLSTFHWRRMVNGWSGFQPRSYALLRMRLAEFPDPRAIRALSAAGVRYAVVGADPRGAAMPRLAAMPPLRTAVRFQGIDVFEVPRWTGPAVLSPDSSAGTTEDASLRLLLALAIDLRGDTEAHWTEQEVPAAIRRLKKPERGAALVEAAFLAAEPQVRWVLARTMAGLNTLPAAQFLARAAQDPSAVVRERAVRALDSMTDPAVRPILLPAAAAAVEPAHRRLLIQRYLVLTLGAGRGSHEETVAALQAAMPVAATPEEKRNVIAALSNVKALASLTALEDYLNDETVRERAAQAVAQVAPAVSAVHPAAARASLDKALQAAQDEVTRVWIMRALEQQRGRGP